VVISCIQSLFFFDLLMTGGHNVVKKDGKLLKRGGKHETVHGYTVWDA